MNIKTADFIKSAPTIREAPAGKLPEFVLLGRSNVGKSSFINCILGRKNLAKTSNTPGKTRLINFYLVNEAWYFVDLPGYGYAKVSKTEQQRWQKDLEEYLRERECIRCAFLLVDARLGPQDSDLQMFEWISFQGIQAKIIMTKADKLSRNEIAKQRQLTSKRLDVAAENVIVFSATSGLGQNEVGHALGELLR